MRRSLWVLVLSGGWLWTGVVSGQQPFNQQRGYDPTGSYSTSGIDSVNLFRGDLSIAIPLGQRYSVGPYLSYGFTLVYNSHLWDFERDTCTQEPGGSSVTTSIIYAEPSHLANAGLGWMLSLGSLSPADLLGGTQLTEYVSPDGGEHALYSKLHEDDASSDPDYSYTRDGSYIRVHKLPDDSSATVEFPDGTTHTFVPTPSSVGGCTPTTCAWRLQQMADRFSNTVTVTYDDSAGTWTISDSLGRTSTVTFSGGRVSSVQVPAFGVGNTATYSLAYSTPTTIARSCLTGQCSPTWPPRTVNVIFLTGIGLPDESSYSMTDANGAPTYDMSLTCSGTDKPGAILSMRLPTGGIIKWSYAAWALPVGCLGPEPVYSETLGVATRQLCDSQGANCATWTYTRPGNPGVYDDYTTTTVTSPPAVPSGCTGNDCNGNDTVYYFRTKSCVTSGSYDGWDYGLPYQTETSVGSGSTLGYLSSIAYQGSTVTGSSRTALRNSYVRFEHDKLVSDPGGSTLAWASSNRRLVYQRTVYADDSSRYADVASSSFDGLGHYRQQVTGGSFDSGNTRTTFTGFNPSPSDGTYRTYQVDSSNTQTGTWSGWTWPTTEAWILGTFDATQQTEASKTAYQEACFERDANNYPSTGFLRATRVLKGSTEAKQDLLAVYTRDDYGQTTTEQFLGGDAQTANLPSYCGSATSTVTGEQYRIDHSWQYGMLKTSAYANTTTSFYTLDLDIDLNTGLPSASRSRSASGTMGIRTDLQYDAMGRVTWEKPTSGAYLHRQYSIEAADPRIETCANANGDTADCVNSATALQRSVVHLDPYGRPILDYELLNVPLGNTSCPGGSTCWTMRKTAYNAMGWTLWQSEWYPSGTADGSLSKTVFTGFDPFGRAGTITLPDTKVVTLGYAGVRQLTRTTSIATSTSSETAVPTTETYDRQGRLYRVTEKSGSGGTNTTTTYTYDVGNRLTTASTTSGVTQVRTFTYDARGLLLYEDLPEKTVPTGFSHDVTYSSYDARGHAGQVVDGASNLTFTFDKAERPTNVKVTGGNSLVDFTYDKLGGALQGYSLGQLVQATRHNWVSSTDVQVGQNFTYSGTGGRVSARTTTLEGRTIAQGYTWNDLGEPRTIAYPDDGSIPDPVRTLTNDYTYGFLTAVEGFADTISYHPNTMLKQIALANGVTVTQELDLNDIQRVRSISTAGASSNWTSGSYAYDGTGNVKSIGSLYFVYDTVSRLTSADAPGGKNQQATFDAFGNILTTRFENGNPNTYPVDASTNRLNQGVNYDSGGHLTYWGGGGYTYTYNELGQLFTVTGLGVNQTILYDAFGERVAVRDTLHGSTTLALRGLDGRLLRTYVEGGTSGTGATTWQEDWVWANGTLLATVSADPDAGTRYYTVDHLGTPRLVTDACATSVAQHNYYAFGLEALPVTQDGERIRYTGQETDLQGTTGQTDDLVNMHARFYNPTIARFLAADLLRGDPHRPQSFNLFAYVKGNPSTLIDPFGLSGETPPKPNLNDGTMVHLVGPNYQFLYNAIKGAPDFGTWMYFVTGGIRTGDGGGSTPGTTAEEPGRQRCPTAVALAGPASGRWIDSHPFTVTFGGGAALGVGALAGELGGGGYISTNDFGGYLTRGAGYGEGVTAGGGAALLWGVTNPSGLVENLMLATPWGSLSWLVDRSGRTVGIGLSTKGIGTFDFEYERTNSYGKGDLNDDLGRLANAVTSSWGRYVPHC